MGKKRQTEGSGDDIYIMQDLSAKELRQLRKLISGK